VAPKDRRARTSRGRSGVSRPRVVVVGAGFAGYETARALARRSGPPIEIVLVNPTDYFLYLPLLPEVAGGVLDPRGVTVPLARTLPGVRLVRGRAEQVDVDRGIVSVAGVERGERELGYDRLVLAAGSVNKLLPVPGVGVHAHGFRESPRPCTCGTTLSGSLSWRTMPTIRSSGSLAARSSWWVRGTPGPRWSPRGSC
jgi:NADH dehydrogenase FAD-containing subunit